MKRRIFAAAIVLAMLLAALSGCAATTETPEPAEESAAQQETPAAESEAPTSEAPVSEEPIEEPAAIDLPLCDELLNLTYMVTVNPMNSGLITSFQDCAAWNELEKRTNVRVDATLVNAQEGQAKFSLMIASGEYSDYLDSVGSNYATGLAGALDDEVIVDLTDIISDHMPNYYSIVQSDEEYIKGNKLDDGRIGMIYALTSTDTSTVTSGPTIRQDWLDAQSLETPVTYDDLYNVLTVFKNEYDASMWIPYTGSPMGNYLGAGFGISTTYMTHLKGREPFYHVDETVLFGPMQDEYYDYLELMAKWYGEGLIWNDFVSFTQTFTGPADDNVTTGDFGVWFGETGKWQVWTQSAQDPDFHIVAFSDPVQKAGDVNHLRTTYEHITNGGISISTQCEEFEVAAKLLDYFYTDEGRMLTTFGVEGETWEYDSEGHPQYTELITANPDGYTEQQALFIYGGSTMLSTMEHPLADYLISSTTADQDASSDIWKETSDQEYYIPILVSMSTDESGQYTAIMSDIGTYISEWSLKVITGEIELTKDGFEEFRQMQVKLGIEDATALKQDAYTRYLAR